MKILGFGPYIGDFKEEIFTFRPYIRWLMSILDFNELYIQSHFNRSFLYSNYINENSNFINVYKNLTRDELHQKSLLHKQITHKDFLQLIRDLRNYISNTENCNKNEVLVYYLKYITKVSAYSIFQKIFDQIEDPKDVEIENNNYLIFIPDYTMSKSFTEAFYNKLKKEYGNQLKVCGDFKTHLTSENCILHEPDYFENGYKYNIKYINNAKAVICPCSHWTAIANLQQIPTFSWGQNIGQYKNGVYSFNNPYKVIINGDRRSSVDVMCKQFKHFLDKID